MNARTGDSAEKDRNVRDVLAAHFVMWHEMDGPGPRGEWRCACGGLFGFSDTAIDHVTDKVENFMREAQERLRASPAGVPGSRTEEEWGIRFHDAATHETREVSLSEGEAVRYFNNEGVTVIRRRRFVTADRMSPWLPVSRPAETGSPS